MLTGMLKQILNIKIKSVGIFYFSSYIFKINCQGILFNINLSLEMSCIAIFSPQYNHYGYTF